MKNTFYGHFVAGEDQNEIKANVENMRTYGVKAILDYSAEEDLEEAKNSQSGNLVNQINNRTIYEPSELQSEKNFKIFMDCIDTVESTKQIYRNFKMSSSLFNQFNIFNNRCESNYRTGCY